MDAHPGQVADVMRTSLPPHGDLPTPDAETQSRPSRVISAAAT